jgi:LmeA-like phospholipid-binding
MVVFGVIVLLILLVIGDRVALAVAENDMADQFVSNGLPVKPSVTIEGFPFLTQLAARDFRKVDISASNIPAGPVTITSATGTLNGLHFNSSFNSATVDHITVRIFVSFAALAGAGGLGNVADLTITPAGPNLLKITGSLGGVLSDTEEAKITQTGPQQISVQAVNNGGALSGVLSQFGSYTFNLPKGVPASLRITGLSLNAQGLTATATADNAKLSKSSS